MKYNLDEIDQHFPLQKYRAGQKEIISKILQSYNDGYKFVVIECPTGTGKSAIAQTINQFTLNNSFYLAPQKILQDQLTSDFGESGKHIQGHWPMIDLKGRNSYPCNYWEKQLEIPNNPILQKQETLERYKKLAAEGLGCDVGECRRDGKSKLKYCENNSSCPYFNQLDKAINSKIVLMNFHSFLYQSCFTDHFIKRELMIIDECDQAESILMSFVELTVSDRYLLKYKIKIPKLQSVNEYIKFFQDNEIRKIIEDEVKIAVLMKNIKDEEEWKQMLHRYDILISCDPKEWVFDWQQNQSKTVNTVIIKPIHVDKFAHEYLFNLADNVLMMSATILSKDIFCKSLGIENKDVKSFKMNSNFPKDLRPIYFRPSGSMSFKNKDETMPKMLKDIENLCKHHQDERGIIHTHTNIIMRYIKDNVSQELKSRLIDQESDYKDKQEMIKEHSSRKNSILIAPAMHTGIDLKDDLARFAIICKVPYANMMDPQIAARKAESNDYFNMLALQRLIQSVGRTVRHKEDWSHTYVLDSDFKNFIKYNSSMCPSWFVEAIIW